MDELQIRLRRAVSNNDLDDIREVKNSTSWGEILEAYPQFLHDVAFWGDQTILDHLLTLPDFPIEHRFEEKTLLHRALEQTETEMYIPHIEKLLDKGASIDFLYAKGSKSTGWGLKTFWYYSYCHKAIDAALLLLRYGLDYSKLTARKNRLVFKCAVILKDDCLINNIYNKFFSKRDNLKLNLGSLYYLAETKNEFFFDIVRRVQELELFNLEKPSELHSKSLKDFMENLDREYWEALLEKIFNDHSNSNALHLLVKTPLDTIKILVESKLKCHVVSYLKRWDGASFIDNLIKTCNQDEDKIVDYLRLLVSYGLERFCDSDLNMIYSQFGYGKLFEYILDQGVSIDYERFSKWRWVGLIPWLICDPRSDIITVLRSKRSGEKVTDLLGYSNLEEVRKESFKENPHQVGKLPKVPLLAEYARNETRKFLVESFHIQTPKQFHCFIKNLPVHRFIKDVITFKFPLYKKFLQK